MVRDGNGIFLGAKEVGWKGIECSLIVLLESIPIQKNGANNFISGPKHCIESIYWISSFFKTQEILSVLIDERFANIFM